MVPKGNRLCSSKNALWLPQDTYGTTCSRQNTPVVLCSPPLTLLSGPGTTSLSVPPHRATARCCCAGRETENWPSYPSHPAQPPGDGAVQGKGCIFQAEAFCWGTGSSVPPCQVQAQCMARDCPPPSSSRQQRQTHTQVRIYFQITHLYHSHMKYFFWNIAYI